jgi:hypothetical protein
LPGSTDPDRGQDRAGDEQGTVHDGHQIRSSG